MDTLSLRIAGASSTAPLLVGYSVVHLDGQSSHDTLEVTEIMRHEIQTYSALLRQIHNDLRVQHPEWVQSNGESPMCDSYEARLIELLDASRPTESNERTAVPT